MKRTLPALLLPAVLLAALLAGCSTPQAVKEYESGQWDGSLYTSRFLSLSFALPDGWTAADEDELEQMNEAAESALDAQLSSDRASREPVYHYALLAKPEDGASGSGVTILVQRSDTEARQYVTAVERGAEKEDAGYTIGESYETTLAGKKYLVLPVTVDGNPTAQRQYVRFEGGFLINIMLFAQSDAEFTTLEESFSAASADA